MNETIRNIKERRSIRAYSDKKISKEILQELADCARLAPSSMGRDPWEFIVITEKETLRKLSTIPTWGAFLQGAAAAIVVCGDSSNRNLPLDCSAAMENILIAAKSLGIGSCWIQAWKKEFNPAIKKLLGIPAGIDLVAIASLGYPAEKPEKSERKSLKDALHWEKF